MLFTIDNLINKITMYRLVLYYLMVLIITSALLGSFSFIPINPIELVLSTVYLIAISFVTQKVFIYIFKAPTNLESVYITAIILALIVTPAHTVNDFVFLTLAAILAVSSKFILAIGKKHIFNPAAIAVTITALVFGHGASWWIGNIYTTPIILLGGLLIARKLRKGDLVFTFMLVVAAISSMLSIAKGENPIIILNIIFLHSSLFFFAFVMLTEPTTTPPNKKLRVAYGSLAGFLFLSQIYTRSIFATPEFALLVVNIFSYLSGPKEKLIMNLFEKFQIAPDIWDFIFVPNQKINFRPGQFLEWTLPHKSPDSRGNRRYFTIASSPTENALRLGVKFTSDGSSFKKALLTMDEHSLIVGGQRGGEFTLPKNKHQKCVFIAGGIGITPFRSMIKYLIDTKEQRPIIVMYANKTPDSIVYKDIFEEAQTKLGIKTVYAVTDTTNLKNWKGQIGRIDAKMIRQEVPDFIDRIFYLSGPHSMVVVFEETLKEMGVRSGNVKKDYFPGYA